MFRTCYYFMAVLVWRDSVVTTSFQTAMSVRYAPIPNPRTDPDTTNELDAAFDDSDDDDDLDESRPLNPPSPRPTNTSTYDFNSPVADWDQPPPGSPPPVTSTALPNSIGNSNGIIPSSTHAMIPRAPATWWRRATAFLPTRSVPQFGQSRPSGRARVMGGGAGNDGVFSNVSAKPTTSGIRVQDGRSLSSSMLPYPHRFSSQAIVSTSFQKNPLRQRHPLMPLPRRTQHRHTILRSSSSLLPPFMTPMPFLAHQFKVQSSSTPCPQGPCLPSSGTHSSALPSSLLGSC